ncbi:hypothetical protein Tco_0879391, partial [Tanacetum coccineum]
GKLKAVQEEMVEKPHDKDVKAKVEWISSGDRNTKYFYKVIASKRNISRIMSVCNDKGERFKGNLVVDQFVQHFQRFLGNNEEGITMNTEKFFINRLSDEEAAKMVIDVTDKEIKEAMFDIGEKKAPGPDGFTFAFFKHSWKIIGKEVCQAIKEFFCSGKILGEINATLITLIPRIPQPNKVSDYRPIACFNVIVIQDYLLTTQELLKGYNCKNGASRCALKIDIAKAYDTKSGGQDVESVKVIKQTLLEFSSSSGIKPNMDKSVVFFGSVKEAMKTKILEVLPFKVGKLQVKYMGIPLLAKKIGIKDCQELVEKIKSRIEDWKNKFLSYAGKLQLISVVLSTMQTYRASVLFILKTVIKEIDRILKKFLWSHGSVKKELRDNIRPHIVHIIGNGRYISMWNDYWNEMGQLSNFVTNKEIYDARMDENSCVADMIMKNE